MAANPFAVASPKTPKEDAAKSPNPFAAASPKDASPLSPNPFGASPPPGEDQLGKLPERQGSISQRGSSSSLVNMRVRTPTLSNTAQVELMNSIKKNRMSVDDALALAKSIEEKEVKPELSNSSQLEILNLVREGTLSQDQALELARQRHQKEKKEREEREHREMVEDYYELLRAIADIRQRGGGAVSPTGAARLADGDLGATASA